MLKLAAPGLNAIHLEKGEIDYCSDHLAHQISLHGIEVITAREVSAVLGFERQRELLGCAGTTCLAEIKLETRSAFKG